MKLTALLIAALLLAALVRLARAPSSRGRMVTTSSGAEFRVLRAGVVPLFGGYYEIMYVADQCSSDDLPSIAKELVAHFCLEAERRQLVRIHVVADIATSRARFVTHSKIVTHSYVLVEHEGWVPEPAA